LLGVKVLNVKVEEAKVVLDVKVVLEVEVEVVLEVEVEVVLDGKVVQQDFQ
jgi:hypothetical protein